MKVKTKYKASPNEIRLLVAASSAISTVGVANGRNIPVVFVPSDEDKKIDNIISFHKNVKEGNCISSWGLTSDKKYVILYLDFQDPIKQKVILFFEIIKFGIVAEQIMYSQCLYLTIGDETSKLSSCMNQERLLIDVYCEDFKTIWNDIFKKEYSKHLKKEYKISKKQSRDMFEQIIKEWDILKKLRIQ